MLVSTPVLLYVLIREPCAYMCVSSYSKVGAVEQRYVVNSGARGTKDRNLRIEVYWYVNYSNTSIVPITYPITCKYRVPVIYRTLELGLQGTSSSLRARRWCSLGPPRTRAGSIACYALQEAVQCAMLCRGSRGGRRRGGEKEGRGNGGWGEGSRSEC
jgi:hypothetical protein